MSPELIHLRNEFAMESNIQWVFFQMENEFVDIPFSEHAYLADLIFSAFCFHLCLHWCWNPAPSSLSGFGATYKNHKVVENTEHIIQHIQYIRYLTESIIQFIKAIFCALVTAMCARWFFSWWVSQWANFLHQPSFPFRNSLFIIVAIEITLHIKKNVCREFSLFRHQSQFTLPLHG